MLVADNDLYSGWVQKHKQNRSGSTGDYESFRVVVESLNEAALAGQLNFTASRKPQNLLISIVTCQEYVPQCFVCKALMHFDCIR